MPTARELLEQADALMRRNRTAAVDDIPVLTDSVPIAEAPLPVRQKMRERAEPARGAGPDTDADGTRRFLRQGRAGSMMGEGEPSDWLDMDEPQPSIIGDARIRSPSCRRSSLRTTSTTRCWSPPSTRKSS